MNVQMLYYDIVIKVVNNLQLKSLSFLARYGFVYLETISFLGLFGLIIYCFSLLAFSFICQ